MFNKRISMNRSFLTGKCRFLFLLFLLLVNCSLLSALDILLRPRAFAFIPMGDGNQSLLGFTRYDIGGGADIGFDFDLSSVWPNPLSVGYTAGFEFGMTTNPVLGNDPKSLVMYSLGATIGLYYFPLSRLFMRIDGSAGIYRGALEGFLSPYGFYWRGGGELGFRFSPSFLIAAHAGWRQYEDSRPDRHAFNSGLYFGVTAQITIESGSGSRSGAESTLIQPDLIYPVFLQLYQSNPVGMIRIRNRENAEIRNVRMSFRADNYTSSEFFCGSAVIIPRGGEIELPLLADFSPAILRFTDNGRILGEVIIRYNFLGQEREAVSVITVASHSRNTITEDDTASLAALISPTSPEVLEYSRYIIGLARSRRRIGHSQNMQYAIWLFEGLRTLGVRIGDTHILDNEAQFPAETLIFGRGSSRDIALLYATALEGIGVASAFLKVGNDYIVGIDLSMTPSASETFFINTDRILIVNDKCWLPVAMSSFDDGFLASWNRGMTTLNQAFAREEFIEFIETSEAWAIYPPAPLPELGTRAGQSNSDIILAEANMVLDQYVVQEIMPIIWRVEAQAAVNPTAALFNRLGILYARAGRLNDAKTNYERAANMNNVAAMTNRGSLALSERDYEAAEFWFRRALTLDPRNNTALRGLERVEGRR